MRVFINVGVLLASSSLGSLLQRTQGAISPRRKHDNRNHGKLEQLIVSSDQQTVELTSECGDFALEGSLILRTACEFGDVKTVKALLDSGWVDLSINDYESFRIACKFGHWEVAKLLHATHAFPLAGIKARNQYAIRKASKYGHVALVEWLVKLGADPAARDNYPLRWAATNGHLEVVRLLTGLPGVKPHARLNEALHSAVHSGHATMVEFLLEQPSVDVKSIGEDLLLLAVSKDHPAVLKVLLSDGRPYPAYDANWLLSMAASEGKVECLEYLLGDERVLSVEPEFNPLNFAIYGGHLEATRLLLAKLPGCDPSVWESRPVRLAAKRNHVAIVQLLLEDPRIKSTPKFNKAIRKAEKFGWTEMYELLMNDPRTSEYHNITSTGIARRRISKGVKSITSPRSKAKKERVELDVHRLVPDYRFIDLSDGDGSGLYTNLSDAEHSQ